MFTLHSSMSSIENVNNNVIHVIAPQKVRLRTAYKHLVVKLVGHRHLTVSM